MPAPIACAGAPRDLGRDQGAASRDRIRVRAAGGALRRALDRAGVCERPLARWRRHVRRHFPHQHEWLEGVARAAGVPDLSLLRAAVAELARERDALLVGVECGRDALLWRTGASDTVLRRIEAEGRLVSVELASPVLACPWIGVNEGGLAVVVTGGGGPAGAHPALLARDCLERFGTVESALDWCLSRPVAEGAAILLADAHGELAGVEFGSAGRRVLRPAGGAIVAGGPRAGAVAKAVSDVGGSAQAVEVALARALGDAAAAVAHAAPAARTLRTASGDASHRIGPEGIAAS